MELAQEAMKELRLGFPMDEPPTPREEAQAAVAAAASTIRQQAREKKERCESCDDTGIYEEGSEWAPCDECELGRGFAEGLKSHAKEIRQSERQRIREALLTALAQAQTGDFKIKLSAVRAALDTLENPDQSEGSGQGG